jgi:hypothetical protein
MSEKRGLHQHLLLGLIFPRAAVLARRTDHFSPRIQPPLAAPQIIVSACTKKSNLNA